ncbi:MAG TPA: V-type ATPase 116kDa subunit family protein [Candidatus Cloacimonadota bacterium]|nr:V-type ATPase 116kDa subunit family protein [Candidatus Cloacimonadota bacterium]HQL14128.1 V-type ATPase 116kDa subunit family protein [Candidatus Cloacimonadota bacterium]
MIEKMRKYTFLIHHSDYEDFLAALQKLGMVHIVKNTAEKTDKLEETQKEIEAYTEAITFMRKYITPQSTKKTTTLHALQLRQEIDKAHLERERLTLQSNVLAKEIAELSPWGEFDYDLYKKLADYGLQLSLFICSKYNFKPEWQQQYALRIINEVGHQIYFAVLHEIDEPCQIEAESFKLPPTALAELKKEEAEVLESLKEIDTFYKENALTAIELFTDELKRLSHLYEYEEATLQGIKEADNQVIILQGWIPQRQEDNLLQLLQQSEVVYLAEDAKAEDNPPVLLRNNWFVRNFEIIGDMFMLPYYNELDMTPFFAPFYLMFFGFCDGDAGYGVIMILLGWLIKKKYKSPGVQRFLTLIQILGAGTIVMGFVMGSFLAYDLKNIPFLNPYIPIRNTGQIFNFALLLGVIQIVTGKLINVYKRMKQSGIVHGISTLGITIFVVSLAIAGSTLLGAKPGRILNYTSYGIYLGLVMIFFFNLPGKNIFLNFANGLWIMYGVFTGFLGDLLSYIRLFALSVSGGILGIVINDMAHQFSAIPIIGPVIFLLFMIGGHSLNIALSGLGAFIHPMRLTFVEFFNNSGFSGPGLRYQPFGKIK